MSDKSYTIPDPEEKSAQSRGQGGNPVSSGKNSRVEWKFKQGGSVTSLTVTNIEAGVTDGIQKPATKLEGLECIFIEPTVGLGWFSLAVITWLPPGHSSTRTKRNVQKRHGGEQPDVLPPAQVKSRSNCPHRR